MKLLFIRHADPDYDRDSLTPQGFKEAKALAQRLGSMNIKKCFVSPLGRAQATASFTVQKGGFASQTLPWLEEFVHPMAIRPAVMDDIQIPWDWLPSDWMERDGFFDKDRWRDEIEMKSGDEGLYYDKVASSLDTLLEGLGYRREGRLYRTDLGNEDTYAFFCHLGVECVMLSHILNISPMILWHGTCALPSSVTTLVTQEREKGIVDFRMLSFGDLTHLALAGLEPSFAARFCETYENKDQRH